jgi:hypothetical protein
VPRAVVTVDQSGQRGGPKTGNVRLVNGAPEGVWRATEQGDEADEAFGGTNPRAASGAQPEVPPNARAVTFGGGHRFAAYPRCSTDKREVPGTDMASGPEANSSYLDPSQLAQPRSIRSSLRTPAGHRQKAAAHERFRQFTIRRLSWLS